MNSKHAKRQLEKLAELLADPEVEIRVGRASPEANFTLQVCRRRGYRYQPDFPRNPDRA